MPRASRDQNFYRSSSQQQWKVGRMVFAMVLKGGNPVLIQQLLVHGQG